MTRASELRELNDDELAHHLVEAREELFSLRFQLAVGKQDNSARVGHVKREVARVLTIQQQRRDGTSPAAPTGRASTATAPAAGRALRRTRRSEAAEPEAEETE